MRHPAYQPKKSEAAFTLVELLVVLAIIGILSAIALPMIPSIMRSNQFDTNVNTLSGTLEEAREAATSGNTYVWVAFTDAPLNSPTGTWVATIQSQDGTETGINASATAPVWATTITVPSTTVPNLQLHGKLLHLPGVAVIVDPATITGAPKLTTINGNVIAAANAKTPSGPVPPVYPSTSTTPSVTSLQGPITWTVTPLQYTGMGTGIFFVHAIEFTPNGEAHVQAWNSNVQFGMIPTTGSANNNSALFNISRLTGKTTVFRQ